MNSIIRGMSDFIYLYGSIKSISSMKVSNAIYRALVCLVVVLGTLSSCITLRPATVVGSKDFGGYKYAYIPPTQAVQSSSAFPILNQIKQALTRALEALLR